MHKVTIHVDIDGGNRQTFTREFHSITELQQVFAGESLNGWEQTILHNRDEIKEYLAGADPSWYLRYLTVMRELYPYEFEYAASVAITRNAIENTEKRLTSEEICEHQEG